jgi:alpha-L-rhamnosidase
MPTSGTYLASVKRLRQYGISEVMPIGAPATIFAPNKRYVLDLSSAGAATADLKLTLSWADGLQDYDLGITLPWGFAGSSRSPALHGPGPEEVVLEDVPHCTDFLVAAENFVGAGLLHASLRPTLRVEVTPDTGSPGPDPDPDPDGDYDYVDLGNAASEQAHNLTASPTSGTNEEAGRTRRYTFERVPSGYFQFDVTIAPGAPFVIRAVETHAANGAPRDYYVLVDGVRVLTRNQAAPPGGGLVTYDIVIDDPQFLTDGIVRIRFEEDEGGQNREPSIADLWTLPVTALP